MAEIFISWSGERSQTIANGLKLWLEDVFPGHNAWMSRHDIGAGARWGQDLSGQLESSNFGIVCLTPENLSSAWIIFEAGALSKALEGSRVVPYRFQLSTAEVGPPLSQFQSVDADHEGTFKLVQSVNEAIGKLHPDDRLSKTFQTWWPDLQDVLVKIPQTAPRNLRSDRAILEEILDSVRNRGSRELREVLARILSLPAVHTIEVAPKQIAGKDTDTIALRVRVAEKLPLAKIPPDERIPTTIFGMPTDVVEV